MHSSLHINQTNDRKEFESLLNSFDYPFTQGFSYGEWQRALQRSVRRFVVRKNAEIVALFQLITYPLPVKKSILLIPHGPVFARRTAEPECLIAITRTIQDIAKEDHAIFTRFDAFPPDWATLPGAREAPAEHSSFSQPRDEWVLAIGDVPEDELIRAMHPKARYAIRFAERKNVTIEYIETDLSLHVADFYALLEKTAQRGGFRLHPRPYYERIFADAEKERNLMLVRARYGERILAAHLIVLFGRGAYFLFGGSADEHRDVMAPHLAHWKTIQYLRARGFRTYNFGAISMENREKSWEGFTVFKKRFGGSAVSYGASRDIVHQPLWYALWRIYKGIQRR